MKEKQNELEVKLQDEIDKYKESRNFHSLLNILTPWIINFLKIRYQADEDATADVLLALSEKMDSIITNYLRTSNFPFLIWMAKIIRNNFYDSLRKETMLSSHRNEDPQINASEQLAYIEKEKKKISLDFFSQLKAEEKLVCKLYYGFEPDFQDLQAYKKKFLQNREDALSKWNDFFSKTSKKRIDNRIKADKIKAKYQFLLQKIVSGSDEEKKKRRAEIEKAKKSFQKLQYNVRLKDLAELCSISIASVSNILNKASRKIYLKIKEQPKYRNYITEENSIPQWIIYTENDMDDISN